MHAKCFCWLLSALLLIANSFPAIAQQPPRQIVDSRELPRVDGASDPSEAFTYRTTYRMQGANLDVADALHKKLSEAGWQRMPHPIERPVRSPSLVADYYKKAPFWFHVYVKPASRGSDQIEIIYQSQYVKDDVTPPGDATDVRFNPHKPHFVCTTGEPVEAAFAHFDPQLTAKGWKRLDMNRETKGSDAAPTRMVATYEGEGDKKLSLDVRQRSDGRTTVEFKPWEAPKTTVSGGRQVDDTTALFEKLVREQIAAHQKPATPKKSEAATLPVEALTAKANGTFPVPVPETSDDLKFDGARGSLEYASVSNVPSIAGFYRQEMKRQGWRDKKSVINNERMVVLNYEKGGKSLSFTIMKFGERTRVTATGSHLESPAPAKQAAARPSAKAPAPFAPPSQPSVTPAPVSDNDLALDRLDAEERNGLVVPKPHSQVGHTKTLFRQEASATVNATVETLVAFYRRELEKRGWTEQPGASIGAELAKLTYETGDGPATLHIQRGDPATSITLQRRRTKDAEKAGMLPKPGQSKLMLANTLEKDCVVQVGKRDVRVKPGAGTVAPDGPALDLPAGSHKVTFKSCLGSPKSETVELVAGETWGLMIGPNGGLALPMY